MPDDVLMPTWYAHVYIMTVDEVARADFSNTLARGRVGTIPKPTVSKLAAKLKAKGKPWAKER
ncbi:MAG: hypothetical protein ACKPKO_06580 [Candidatus Fonsibacter sp.]